MLFNTWFGQMRKNGDKFYYQPKRPIGKIQLKSLAPPGQYKRYNTQYEADTRGNMEISSPEHIKDFVALGYPIYNGVFMEDIQITNPNIGFIVCPRYEFLLWPDNPEYDNRVLDGLKINRRFKEHD